MAADCSPTSGPGLQSQQKRISRCSKFTVWMAIKEHATTLYMRYSLLNRHGGLPILRHNDIRDITANWLSEVCHDVEREPPLLPLTGETIIPQSANRRDDARADIRARGFWGWQQSAFFDVRVCHPNAQSYRRTSIPAMYRRHEQAGDRIREVERPR